MGSWGRVGSCVHHRESHRYLYGIEREREEEEREEREEEEEARNAALPSCAPIFPEKAATVPSMEPWEATLNVTK